MLVVRQPTEETRQGVVPASCSEAFRTHAQTVARWARHLGGVDMDVEDVVQDVFIVVSRRLAEFRCEAQFSSWLFEITRKTVANHRRRQQRRLWRSDHAVVLASVPAEGPDPVAELERRQAIARLYAALDRLPERYRTVFVLHEIEGLSVPAIAELRALRVATVRVQLSRARARLITQYRRLWRREPA